MEYDKGDIVSMKKLHACQTGKPKKEQINAWEITRMGMDIKIRCLGCQHVVMLKRSEFNRKVKAVIKRKEEK